MRARYWVFMHLKSDLATVTIIAGLNSLAPGKFEWNFRHAIFKQILVIDGWGISCEIALIWMSLDFTDDQPILVQVMAWCHQATSHYLSQCWPSSLAPYGVARPQWVNDIMIYVFCQSNVWLTFCHCHRNTEFNIMTNFTYNSTQL